MSTPDTLLSNFAWINPPKRHQLLEGEILTLYTDPETDYWQRTYYGFCNDNAHTFVTEIEGNFSFSVKTEFESSHLYDQCGIVLYQDSENWVKGSIEYETEEFCRLGSVVTNLGYSDWATTDIPADVRSMWYRLSRREADFYLENSSDGTRWTQLRMFHMHRPIGKARVGIYACSPLQSSMKARFSHFHIGECCWK